MRTWKVPSLPLMQSLSVSRSGEESGWTSILCESLHIRGSSDPDDDVDEDDCSSLASDASSGSFRHEVNLGWEGGSLKGDACSEDQFFRHRDDCGSYGSEGRNYSMISKGTSVAGKKLRGDEVMIKGYEERALTSSKSAASTQHSSTKVRNRDAQTTRNFNNTYPTEQYEGTNTNRRKVLKWSWIKQF